MSTSFYINWKQIPFVRFILPLVLGIITGVFVGMSIRISIGMILVGAIGLLVTENTTNFVARILLEKWVLLPVSLLLFGLGALLVDRHTTIDKQEHFSNYPSAEFLRGQIIETPQSKKKSYKVVMEVQEVSRDSSWLPTIGNLLVYLHHDEAASKLEIGDMLLLPVRFREVEPPANPGEFDYKRFLSFRDIYHQQYLPLGQWALLSSEGSLRRIAERWRAVLRASLDRIGMSDEEEAIASALLLGKKDELGPELTRSYASAGAMHVLAVSGLHVGIIYFILQFFLKWMDRLPKGKMMRALILILCLWIYAFVTGLSPSVVRAATMFSAVSLATGLDRRSNIYNTVASSAFLLLIYNPFYIMEVGFQLSYLAVLGIIYLHPKIYSLFYFPSKIPDKLWEISAVSISAQLATFPLGLLYFHQFPSYFLLSNLIVIPAAFFILYIGICYLAVGWIPVLGAAIGKLLSWSILGLNMSVAWVEQLPYSLIQGVDISIVETWLIYAIVATGAIVFIYWKKRALVVATGLVAAMMVMQVYEVLDFKRHKFLVVYDVRGDSMINILSNKENLVYCDEKWVEDLDKQQFHLKNNWNKHSAPEPFFIKDAEHPSIKKLNESLFLFKGKSIMIMDDKADLLAIGKPIAVDYLILSYHRGLSMKTIGEWVSADHVIFDSTIRGKTIDRLCEEAEGQAIHVVDEDGYFSTRL